jgi:hypothetical protein
MLVPLQRQRSKANAADRSPCAGLTPWPVGPGRSAARVAAGPADALRPLCALLEADLVPWVRRYAPSLLALRGCGVLTAAKLVGETADVRRFHSRTPMPATTAPPRCRCGRPTRSAIVSAVPATASSTWRCTASPLPRPATTLTPSVTSPAPRQRQHPHRGDPRLEATPVRRGLPGPPRRHRPH